MPWTVITGSSQVGTSKIVSFHTGNVLFQPGYSRIKTIENKYSAYRRTVLALINSSCARISRNLLK